MIKKNHWMLCITVCATLQGGEQKEHVLKTPFYISATDPVTCDMNTKRGCAQMTLSQGAHTISQIFLSNGWVYLEVTHNSELRCDSTPEAIQAAFSRLRDIYLSQNSTSALPRKNS